MRGHGAHTTHATCKSDVVKLARFQLHFFDGLISPTDKPDMAILLHGLDLAFKTIHKVRGCSSILSLGPLVIVLWISFHRFSCVLRL